MRLGKRRRKREKRKEQRQDIDVEFSESMKELKKAWAELVRAIKKGAIR